MEFLDREGAPFDEKVWEEIDRVARRTIKDLAVGRRLVATAGPLGMHARVGIGDDRPTGDEEEAGAVAGEDPGETHVHVPRVRTMPLLHHPFRIGVRAVEAFHTRGEPLDTRAVAEAARALALTEERIVFQGLRSAGIQGLLRAEGAHEVEASDWSDPAGVADDLLGALAQLDEAGRHGPYAVAVAPSWWYRLFRPFPGTSLTPHAQLSPLFEGGIVKAPALESGAVVVARDDGGPKLVLGQDAVAGFDGREGIYYRFSLFESVTLLPGGPGAVAVVSAETAHRRQRPERESGNAAPRPDELM